MLSNNVHDLNFNDWSNNCSSKNCCKNSGLWVCSRKCVFSASWNQLSKTVVLTKSSFCISSQLILYAGTMRLRIPLWTELSCRTHVNTSLVTDSFSFLLSLFFLCQAELFRPNRNCSTNTELIYRMSNLEHELCVQSIRVEVYGISAILLLQNSATQKHWYSWILDDLCLWICPPPVWLQKSHFPWGV